MTPDEANARFWDELCGTGLARSLGIVELNRESLARFDAAYLAYYPYLAGIVERVGLPGHRVLEIGLGFGTITEYAARRAGEFDGVDIAAGPVALARRRLEFIGSPPDRVIRASALELPYPDATFDGVISIGALHHTGDLPRAIDEVWRVLQPGGRAVVMVYNAHSLRRLMFIGRRRLATLAHRPGGPTDADLRAAYDPRTDGSGAPHTDFVSGAEARRLFRRFSTVSLERRNFDPYRFGRRSLRRSWFLHGIDRWLGLDLYVVAVK